MKGCHCCKRLCCQNRPFYYVLKYEDGTYVCNHNCGTLRCIAGSGYSRFNTPKQRFASRFEQYPTPNQGQRVVKVYYKG